jgi:putative transposase
VRAGIRPVAVAVVKLARDRSFSGKATAWTDNWERVIPFFEFPEEVRRVIYSTNAVQSLQMTLRKIIK